MINSSADVLSICFMHYQGGPLCCSENHKHDDDSWKGLTMQSHHRSMIGRCWRLRFSCWKHNWSWSQLRMGRKQAPPALMPAPPPVMSLNCVTGLHLSGRS